jgi:hypothetical protein
MHQKKYILWTTNIKSSLSYVTQYRSIRLREVMMLVMALVMNQTFLLYTGIVALRVTKIVPPLILSLMLVVDLQVLLTKALLHKRSIVD